MQSHNDRARRANFAHRTVFGALLPLQKTTVGRGPPLEGGAPLLEVPVVAVGAAVPGAPVTVGAANVLTAAAINRLAVGYHDRFGIVNDDDLSQQRLKYIAWCCGGA